MIVFLTGPFGIGKTTVARLLVDRIAGSLLYDPEMVGALLRTVLNPVDKVDDFQDYAVWRSLVVDVARRLTETYGRPLVIPMTILRHDYFETITSGFRDVAPEFLCIRLTASREVLTGRILGRPDADGGHAWCLGHLEAGLAAAAQPMFGIEIPTDGRTPVEVADAVLWHLPVHGAP